MMKANLFPAVLLAGPPHSGKSVLSYLLTMRLRQRRISHYLLRAVPDGEGDWFLEGDPNIVRPLRLSAKTGYSRRFVSHMRSVIESRMIPLLVDVGGKPQGDEQFAILAACTHAIVLYRSEIELTEWRGHLAKVGVPVVAELRSDLNGQDSLQADKPYLRAIISGLDREKEKRRQGDAFDAVAACVEGICHYDDEYLEQLHSRSAPFQFVSERELGNQLLTPVQANWWQASQLGEAMSTLESGVARSIYGRGPVWLAAGLAVRSLPAPAALFDVRFGWITIPAVHFRDSGVFCYTASQFNGGEFLDFHLPEGGVFEPKRITMPQPVGQGGIVLSGKLPRWAFASLARKFAVKREWVGIDDPKQNRIVVVHSNTPDIRIGDVLIRQPLTTSP